MLLIELVGGHTVGSEAGNQWTKAARVGPDAVEIADLAMSALDPGLAQLRSEVRDDLARWAESTCTGLRLVRWLAPGFTSAQLCVVEVSRPSSPVRHTVLKACPPGTASEPHIHNAALAQAPRAFAHKHLVSQPLDPVLCASGWSIMFQDLADDDLANMRSLSSLRQNPVAPAAVKRIVKGVLTDWNPNDSALDISASDYLAAHLGLQLEQDSSLLSWAARVGRLLDPAHLWVLDPSDATVVPNPLAVARGNFELPTVRTIMGRAHGDLHGGNILLPVRPLENAPRHSDFRLIDLSAYASHAPLARDPVHLILSLVAEQWTELSFGAREAVSRYLIDPQSTPPLDVPVGLHRIIDESGKAETNWLQGRGISREWSLQRLLSIVGCSLRFIPRSGSDDHAWWFFWLAARAAHRFAAWHGLRIPRHGAVVSPLANADIVAARDTAEALIDACSLFDGSTATIALLPVGSLTPEANHVVGSLPWDLVVDFDPSTDTTGAFRHAPDGPRGHRLVDVGQEAIFTRHCTTWLAASGLRTTADALNSEDALQWRVRALPTLANALTRLAQVSTRSATLVLLGPPDARSLWILDAAVDRFSGRLHVVHIGGEDDRLSVYHPSYLQGNASAVVSASAAVALTPRTEAGSAAIPSTAGLVELTSTEIAYFEEVGELLHSRVGIFPPASDSTCSNFFDGHRITWFDLDVGRDIPRDGSQRIEGLVRQSLKNRETTRIPLPHRPGAGGTTVARRVAWTLHNDYPVLVVERLQESVLLANRVRDLYSRTGLSILVVAELTNDSVIEDAYSRLRATVPVTFLSVARRLRPPTPGTIGHDTYLGYLSESEKRLMRDHFTQVAPLRERELAELTRNANRVVPFHFGLAAFGRDYTAVGEFVEHTLEGLPADEREALCLIALCHRFAALSLPAVVLADVLRLPVATAPDRTARRLAERLEDLLIEEPRRYWRTLHPVVAEEILRQALRPSSGYGTWTAKLGELCIRLIQLFMRLTNGTSLPNDMRQILERLFLLRDNQDAVGSSQIAIDTRPDFAELVRTVGTLGGRLEIFRSLSESFPAESHFWAHYGRLLAYAAMDFTVAHQMMRRALEVSSGAEDATLYHMSGMVYRKELEAVVGSAQHLPPGPARREAEQVILALAEQALSEFRRARLLNDASEYPHVATARLCIRVIEFGQGCSGRGTYRDFFSLPTSAPYCTLLAEAEDALDAVREIIGGDKPSFRLESAANDLLAFYDDFVGMVRAWRGLLERTDFEKGPIRRRIVRALKGRADTWPEVWAASQTSVRSAVQLLEENLRDDPYDWHSTREWLRASRPLGPSLDRAAELVSYWVEASPSRDAYYYDYVIAALQAIAGRASAIVEYGRKVEASRLRSANFPNRRHVYEWLGDGQGLGRLIQNRELGAWDRRVPGAPDPSLLGRIEGKIVDISDSDLSGSIEVVPGVSVFFTPIVNGFSHERDLNARVSVLLGFSYDGPQGWAPRRLAPPP